MDQRSREAPLLGVRGFDRVRRGPLQHEFQQTSYLFATASEQFLVPPREHMHGAWSRKQLVPRHLRMKKARRVFGRDDQFRGARERDWNVPRKRDQRPYAG